jgi:hypothetical protein
MYAYLALRLVSWPLWGLWSSCRCTGSLTWQCSQQVRKCDLLVCSAEYTMFILSIA